MGQGMRTSGSDTDAKQGTRGGDMGILLGDMRTLADDMGTRGGDAGMWSSNMEIEGGDMRT